MGSQVSVRRYKNVSEVIRAGLGLLENEENKVIALRNAIREGLNSPIVENFDFEENLKKLKSENERMFKISFREKANEDLNNIWNYTYENWSENQADKYCATIKCDCLEIRKNPKLGKFIME